MNPVAELDAHNMELETEISKLREDLAIAVKVIRRATSLARQTQIIWAMPGDDHERIVEFLGEYGLGVGVADHIASKA